MAINDRIVTTVDDIHRMLTAATPQTALEVALIRSERKFVVLLD